jgi:signal transduction histidine kinase
MSNSGHDDGPSFQQQVALLKGQLAQAQKLTALGDLISTTTHEFNNVLMTIINYAKMGMRHKDTATRDKALDKILTAANRAAKITNGILGFARNRSQSLEPTDLIRVVEDSLVLLEREMTKYRVRVETNLDRVTPPALANGNQIQQVLMNLLINARQAMPNGGLILIKLGFDAAAQMVELVVRDTGSGMTPEVLHKIFDPYYSTKAGPDDSGKGGTGLGLSMCRDIIEAHHGRIRVESTPGKGTAFSIKLPAAVMHHADTEGTERKAIAPQTIAPIALAPHTQLPNTQPPVGA